MEVVERDIRDSIDHDLNVKMRAATESLRINNKSALKAKYHGFKALFYEVLFCSNGSMTRSHTFIMQSINCYDIRIRFSGNSGFIYINFSKFCFSYSSK